MRRRLKIATTAVVAMVGWMFATIGVAVPNQILSFDIYSIAPAFIGNDHFGYVTLLLIVDIAIAVLVFRNQRVRDQLYSWWGTAFLLVVVGGAIVLFLIGNSSPTSLTAHHVPVFVCLLVAFGLLRIIVYLGESPDGSPGGGGAPLKNESDGVIQPKFTAIPVNRVSQGR